jgi:hypothetical protein
VLGDDLLITRENEELKRLSKEENFALERVISQ